MPLPYRWLTSLMVRYNGSSILIDCGEGTQIAMKEKGWSPKPIDVICFTHYHADHISGLPGMLLTMGNAERTEPLILIGPKGLERVVNALRVIAPELPFEIKYMEITEKEQSFQFDGYRIEAFRVNHNAPSFNRATCRRALASAPFASSERTRSPRTTFAGSRSTSKPIGGSSSSRRIRSRKSRSF